MNHDTSWVLPLIGLKWVSGARGPTEFDCWGLLCYVYREQFGIELDNTGIADAHCVLDACRYAAVQQSNPVWSPQVKPQHGDAVAMSENRRIHHVGIYLDLDRGHILHAREGGNVVCQPRFTLAYSGINTVKFYRHEHMLRTSRTHQQSV